MYCPRNIEKETNNSYIGSTDNRQEEACFSRICNERSNLCNARGSQSFCLGKLYYTREP